MSSGAIRLAAGRSLSTATGNWRLTFAFEGTDAVLLDYEDYH